LLLTKLKHIQTAENCVFKPVVSLIMAYMQFNADKQVPEEHRVWLRCDVDDNAHDVVIVLARRDMLQTAIQRGIGEPIYMDATHGMQKYGLKVVTVHVKGEEFRGMILRPASA
jgi:hypothetical protein